MKNRPETPSPSGGLLEEEELILHFYGESADPEAVESALKHDAELARRYALLARDLTAARLESPEPPADLAAKVWRELRPRLAQRHSRRAWLDRLRSALAGTSWGPGWTLATATLALIAALALGYFAGRRQAPATPTELVAAGLSPAARERLLLASVEDHLAGSERLLTRVTNAMPTDAAALAEESAWAEALVSSNRLYRRAAERSGQRRIVALLDELEPLLLELAHSESAAPDDLAAAQRRIEHTDLLFKLRVTGERLQRDAGTSRATLKPTTRSES